MPVLEIQNKAVELSQKERIQRISSIIRFAEKRLRKRFPILNKQNFLGAFILMYSSIAVVINSVLYIKGYMPAWMCILLNAFCTSFLHEMEHDLIHCIYFRTKPLVQNLFMGVIWFFRGNLISPWYRKFIHLLHHRESGQVNDIEERLIGNGMKYDLKRLMLTLDTSLTWINFHTFVKQIKQFNLKQILFATFPMFIIFNIVWFSFLAHQSWKIITVIHSFVPPFPEWYISLINVLMVIYVAPNMLRQFSLSLISSTCHYYGDFEKGDLFKQVQVLQPWFLAPLQLFCFNFGSTHVIHHFVVNQPFYLRQMVAPLAHAAMKKYGIRFNDLGTFLRNNRYETAAV
jgi:fatty acid desaturase